MSWEIEGPDIIGDNVWHASSFEGKGEHGKAVFFTPTEGSRGEVEVHLDDVGLADDGIVYNGVLDLRDPNDHLEFVERLGKRFPDIDWTEPLDLIRRSGKFGGAMTVAELLAATPDRTPWCCEGLVAPGLLTVMVADPKAGKTQFAIGLGGAGLTEGAFAGREARFGSVLYCTEQGRSSIRDQLVRGRITGETGSLLILNLVDVYGLSWPRKVEFIESIVRDLPGPVLVVIDTISEWIGIGENQENENGAMRSAMSLLRHLAQKADAAVLALHHARKSAASDRPTEMLRGASAIAASADILLGLTAQKGRVRKLTGEGRYEEAPRRVLIEWSEDGSYVLKGTVKAKVAKKAEEEILALLEDGGTYTEKQIIEETGIARTTVRRVLERLVSGDHGLVTSGDGTKEDSYLYRLEVTRK